MWPARAGRVSSNVNGVLMIGGIAIVLVLAGLIFFHELGHFLAARAMGIGVRTFSVGFGKALVSWRGKKTRYQISMIPLGGYVDLVGMSKDDNIEAPFTAEDSYNNKGPLKRLVTVAAGPLFNIVLAWFIYWGLAWGGVGLALPEIEAVMPDSAAEKAGVMPGDMITRIDDMDIRFWDDIPLHVQAGKGATMQITVLRNGAEHILAAMPHTVTGEDDNGKPYTVYLLGIAGSGRIAEMGFFAAGSKGFEEAMGKTTLVIKLVRQMFSSEGSIKDNLGGPIMVGQTVHHQATHAGVTGVLKLAALLSINLGLLNLLPIPALDGGHVVFNSIELVCRRPVPERFQASATYLGFVFLIGVMILATALDLFRIAS